MGKDLTWVAIKLKQLLDKSPYVSDYLEYVPDTSNPALVYKDFIISIEGEDRITLGFQPTLGYKERNELMVKMEKMIDKVDTKYL